MADRGSMRVRILDQQGTSIAEWEQFGRPSGVCIRNEVIYVGKVIAFILDPREMMGTSGAEGVAIDAKGNVYGGEVGPQQVARHAKQ